MTNEERRKLHAELKQKHYQECTDDIYLLYQSFRRSGFNPDQAFELTTTYVRQTVFDNAMSKQVKGNSLRAEELEYLRQKYSSKGEENADTN